MTDDFREGPGSALIRTWVPPTRDDSVGLYDEAYGPPNPRRRGPEALHAELPWPTTPRPGTAVDELWGLWVDDIEHEEAWASLRRRFALVDEPVDEPDPLIKRERALASLRRRFPAQTVEPGSARRDRQRRRGRMRQERPEWPEFRSPPLPLIDPGTWTPDPPNPPAVTRSFEPGDFERFTEMARSVSDRTLAEGYLILAQRALRAIGFATDQPEDPNHPATGAA